MDQIRAAEARLPDRTREPATLRRLAEESDAERENARRVLVRIASTPYRDSHRDWIEGWRRNERDAKLRAARLRNLATREERRRRG